MAVQDTAGLTAFHKEHENNYMWGERADASVLTFTGTESSMIEKALQLVSENVPNNEILETINKEGQVLNISRRLYQKGDNEMIDAVSWTPGVKNPVEKDNETIIVIIHTLLEPGIKQLNEVRGLVTADFQNHLEKEWIKELRAKFPVKVNDQLLSQIK